MHPDPRPGLPMRLAGLGVKVAKAVWYWQRIPRLAAEFAETHVPECRYFIFGHIHRAGIWRLGGRWIINTGAYDMPSRPRAVIIEDRHIAVHRVLRDGAVYRLAEQPLQQWQLAQPAIPGVPGGIEPARSMGAA